VSGECRSSEELGEGGGGHGGDGEGSARKEAEGLELTNRQIINRPSALARNATPMYFRITDDVCF